MSTAQPLVSIVLPTRNGERFIREALDSCLRQTHANLELIVVNDGSTDRTEEIVLALDDPRLRYLRADVGRGLPGALNLGFAKARGDFLTWTSDDNYFADDGIASMLAEFTRDPRLDVVYADEIRVDADGRPVTHCRSRRAEYLVYFCCINGPFLYRRRVREVVGDYDPSTFLAEDYDFWVRAYVAGLRFHHLEKVLYYYRLHGASLTSTRGAEVEAAAQRVRARHLRPHHRLVAALRRYASWVASPSRMAADRRPRHTPCADPPKAGP